MIVAKIIGGLGNQMFQYAAGRALAARRGGDFAIDRGDFAVYRTHAYGLHNFALEVADVPPALVPRPAGQGIWPRCRGRVRDLVDRVAGRPPLTKVVEAGQTFDPAVAGLPDNVYLDGYWQSERYFADHADLIRADFAIRAAPSPENRRWLEMIGQGKAVSLHVRRGDYVTSAAANTVHGTCDLDYYDRAVADMRTRLGDPVFFVFSDDPAWVRDNLRFDGATHHFVANNDAATNYEDLRLMAACDHHVIANSTFSWWGAWLNPSPHKVVVAPARWFRADGFDDRDLVPAAWVRL